MTNQANHSVVLPLGGAVVGSGISATVGGVGLAGSFGAVGLGMGSMAVAGAVTGGAVYGGVTGLAQGDPVAYGAVGLGVIGGAGVSATVGGIGLVGGFGGVSLGMGVMSATGGIIGLGLYGIAKILDGQAVRESPQQAFTRAEDRVLSQEAYNLGWAEVDPVWAEITWKQQMMAIEVEEELQQLKRKLQGTDRPAYSSTFFNFTRTCAGKNTYFQIPHQPTPESEIALRLWQCVKTINAHLAPVNDLAISAGGILATASADKSVKLWNLHTGKLGYTFFGGQEKQAVAISPNHQLVIAGDLGQNITGWQLKTKQLSHKFSPDTFTHQSHAGLVLAVTFRPQGDLIASGSADKTVRLWTSLGRLKRTLNGHRGAVSSLAFHPSGSLLVSGSADKTMRLWDVNSYDVPRILTGHEEGVSAVAIDPAGVILASGSTDGTVKLWDLLTGQLRITLPGHTNGVWSLAMSPDGTILASGSADGTVRLWQLPTGELLQVLSGSHPVAFSRDGKYLVSGGRVGQLKVWQVVAPRYLDDTTVLTGEWWEVLGVFPDADSQTVKVAYYQLAKRYHPDLNASAVAKANIQAITQAYEEFRQMKV